MKTKFLIPAATALLLACGNLFAESLPLQSVNKAGEVIDAAIEAHGGAGFQHAVRTIRSRDAGFADETVAGQA